MRDDHVFTFDDIEVLIHEEDMIYFNNTIVDYVKGTSGRGKFQVSSIES